jgi:hypothetical protein
VTVFVLICGRVSFFDDDVVAACDGCAAVIVHRPQIPDGAFRLCADCGGAWLVAEARGRARVGRC